MDKLLDSMDPLHPLTISMRAKRALMQRVRAGEVDPTRPMYAGPAFERREDVKPTTQPRQQIVPSGAPPKQADARGLLIPDDIIKNASETDSLAFWSTHQFYIKENFDPENMLKSLSAIPDHHFCLIRSLCLDFGWGDPERGFLRSDDRTKRNLGTFKKLIDDILRRGNQELSIKLLWSTTMSIPLEQLTTWQESQQRWGYSLFESLLATFMRFKNEFRGLGYDEDRVWIISRVIWKDELPDIVDWCPPQYEEYEEYEDRVYEIDPVSKEFVWKELWESVRMSYGLMWDPIEGHFDISNVVNKLDQS